VYERARRPDCDDVVLWNGAGEVTESTTANVVARLGGRLVTPPVVCGLLAGTFRAELLTTGAVVEACVTTERLADADALWLVNSVRGWRPAVLVK
jgi:para-aminobenzoate synthetase/4-amino-4-deoxychorismate lyase